MILFTEFGLAASEKSHFRELSMPATI